MLVYRFSLVDSEKKNNRKKTPQKTGILLALKVMCYNIFSLTDACDPSWGLSRDGLIIAAFVVSSLVLVLAIILLIIAYCLHKNKVRNYSLFWIAIIRTCTHFVAALDTYIIIQQNTKCILIL